MPQVLPQAATKSSHPHHPSGTCTYRLAKGSETPSRPAAAMQPRTEHASMVL